MARVHEPQFSYMRDREVCACGAELPCTQVEREAVEYLLSLYDRAMRPNPSTMIDPVRYPDRALLGRAVRIPVAVTG